MKKLAISLLLLLGLSTVFAHDPPKPPQPPGVIHVVLVWLKDPGNAAHRQQIIEDSKTLADIPGIKSLRVGEVLESEREVVDDSFDVALYMRFASQADMDAYLRHPDHVNIVKTRLAPLMERYRVHDFMDE